MNKNDMMKKIQTLDFVVADVSLFLDTHPYDDAALRFRNKYKALYDAAVSEYEHKFGAISRNSADAENGWTWIDGHWPWELEA